MTRFARARGSKSSNAKTPEEATEWVDLKRAIEGNSSVHKTDSQPSASSTPPAFRRSESKGEPLWADFDEPTTENMPTKSMKRETVQDNDHDTSVLKRKRKKSKSSKDDSVSELSNLESDAVDQVTSTSRSSSKRSLESNNPDASVLKRKRKKSKPSKDDSVSELSNLESDAVDQKVTSHSRFSSKRSLESSGGHNRVQRTRQKNFNEEKGAIRVNGVDIEVEKFEGYFVKAEDAVRLKELRKRMIKEGIPRGEIKKAIQLERRRAEKALVKEKKKVCFKCRKPGHVFSECPRNQTWLPSSGEHEDGSTGLCYKCGSTEHTHFECKVQKNSEYRFAKCFICHEQGHISSQCPDNPKGLYPKGGGCNICGEVTHLKKDCPQVVQKRSENIATIETLDSVNIEANSEDILAKHTEVKPKILKGKVVKF